MSSSDLRARDVLAEALRLPERDRAAIAAELLASLPSRGILREGDEDFPAEVMGRAERVRSGESPGLDWNDMLEELSAP